MQKTRAKCKDLLIFMVGLHMFCKSFQKGFPGLDYKQLFRISLYLLTTTKNKIILRKQDDTYNVLRKIGPNQS